MPFGPATCPHLPARFPLRGLRTCTFPTTPARYARALALGLARWYAAGEGAREARGAGRVAGRPDVPAGAKAAGSPRGYGPSTGRARERPQAARRQASLPSPGRSAVGSCRHQFVVRERQPGVCLGASAGVDRRGSSGADPRRPGAARGPTNVAHLVGVFGVHVSNRRIPLWRCRPRRRGWRTSLR